MTQGPPLDLSVRGLTVNAPSGRPILTVDDLTITNGQAVGIRGPSGAGKSTFLYAVAGLARDMSGSIAWGGQELMAMNRSARTAFRGSNMGFVFQDFLLFEELSALGNAALAASYAHNPADRQTIKQRARQRLDILGLGQEQRHVDSFSGGERQRVAIARALAADAQVILADEPTASLDRKAADQLVDDLVALTRSEGKTLIAVSHDLALHERMDRVITIEDGRVSGEALADA